MLPEEGKSYICGKTCGNKVLTDLFDGIKDKIVFEKDLILSLGQEGGTSHIYQISDNKVDKVTSGNIMVRGFDYSNSELAYFYSTPEKPVILKYRDIEYDPNPNVKRYTPFTNCSRKYISLRYYPIGHKTPIRTASNTKFTF